MNRFFSRLLGTTLFLMSVIASAQSGPPFALFIRVPDETVRAGSEVSVSIVLENTSIREIGILKSSPEFDYFAEVRDASGNLVPDTDLGRKLKAPGTVAISTASPIFPLRPNEILEDKIIVSKFSTMTAPGKYSIKVMRTVPPDLGKGIVNSNTISVTITP